MGGDIAEHSTNQSQHERNYDDNAPDETDDYGYSEERAPRKINTVTTRKGKGKGKGVSNVPHPVAKETSTKGDGEVSNKHNSVDEEDASHQKTGTKESVNTSTPAYLEEGNAHGSGTEDDRDNSVDGTGEDNGPNGPNRRYGTTRYGTRSQGGAQKHEAPVKGRKIN